MGSVNLGDIRVTPLSRISVAGGDVLHAMKSTDDDFAGFGEAYFSTVGSGCLKAWKRHTRMVMNLIVPVGLVQFVFHDADCGGIREEIIGDGRYMRLMVPPGIWFGFKGMADYESLVLNLASIPHDPEEVERLPVSSIAYDWS